MGSRAMLRAGRIFSTHDILVSFGIRGSTDVACFYARISEPLGMVPGCYIYSPSHRTDPQARRHDHRCKTFVGERSESMPRALAWASRRYGVTEWAPCPLDAYAMIPRVVREAALTCVRELGY